jgi:DNA-binding IclR family transcriptional regulator
VATIPNTSVDQSFAALYLLSGTAEPIGVADLARRLGLPITTAHRLLVTLHDAGFAARDTTGAKYELGPRAYELVHGLFAHYGIRDAALPFLAQLTRHTGETTALDVRVGWLTIRIAGYEGGREIHAGTLIGRSRHLADTSAGLAILASLDDGTIDRYLAWEAGRRPDQAPEQLLTAIATARSTGFARRADNGDGYELSFSVNHEGRALAAVTLNGTGPLVASDQPPADELTYCRKVISGLEELIAEQPPLARDPFADLGPEVLYAAVHPAEDALWESSQRPLRSSRTRRPRRS